MNDNCWNRCDKCGKFISYDDFSCGAMRIMILPDSDYSQETYETFCIKHAEKEKQSE